MAISAIRCLKENEKVKQRNKIPGVPTGWLQEEKVYGNALEYRLRLQHRAGHMQSLPQLKYRSVTVSQGQEHVGLCSTYP